MLDKHKPFRCETCFWFVPNKNDPSYDVAGQCHRYPLPPMLDIGKHTRRPMLSATSSFCGEHQDGPPGLEKEKSQHPYAERNKRLRAILELNEAKCPLFGKVKLFTLVHQCKHREDGRCKLDEKGPWCWMIRCDDPNADPKLPFYEDKPWNVVCHKCDKVSTDANHHGWQKERQTTAGDPLYKYTCPDCDKPTPPDGALHRNCSRCASTPFPDGGPGGTPLTSDQQGWIDRLCPSCYEVWAGEHKSEPTHTNSDDKPTGRIPPANWECPYDATGPEQDNPWECGRLGMNTIGRWDTQDHGCYSGCNQKYSQANKPICPKLKQYPLDPKKAMKSCPDDRDSAPGCYYVAFAHRCASGRDPEKDKLKRCFFCKTGDEA